ncbi:hypothetical protein SKAU_G00193430 [Synaphobranchus kaupii]|uniref:Uncharacterized protein n=1 Tax=Synaphobranchus kaupii TaxID=118154 RepID=A0A9Q1FE53_SYNKA|nr:hypothetical protein SKAU_G00193430 [Synaphobranchus kaupii]
MIKRMDHAPRTPQTPRTPVSVQRIQDCLSLLEVEITEFKENKLQENDTIQQLKEELRLFKEETKLTIRELGDKIRTISKDNGALKDTLSRVREELVQRERDMSCLSQQLVSVTTAAAAAEQPQTQTTDSQTDPENSPGLSPTVPQPEIPPATQPAPPQPSPRPPQPTQPPKTAILIDSNGKFLHHRKLFPRHKVAKFWCPTTDRALQLLCQSSLDNPDNIVIHTGTNDLRSKREGVSEAVREMAEKAHRVFPEANIVISTLLPRTDFPQHMINKINKKITKDCAPMTNINIAHHPAITHEHLYDGLHLDQDSVRIFAKSIKDTALGRSPLTHHHSQGPLDTCHPITETSAQPRMTQPNRAYARMTQPSGAQPSVARPRTTQPSAVRPSPAQPDPAQRSPTQPSGAQPSAVRPSPAQTDPGRPSPVEPDPGRPSPAEPSPAKPTAVGPSPAAFPTATPSRVEHHMWQLSSCFPHSTGQPMQRWYMVTSTQTIQTWERSGNYCN